MIYYTKLREEDEIISSWSSSSLPLASLVCITYNHARFIEDAIIGMLNQVITFPFEIIIYDDCSTDQNKEKITSLCKNYPKIVKMIFSARNNFCSLTHPLITGIKNLCVGKYTTMLDDDYWIKLNTNCCTIHEIV